MNAHPSRRIDRKTAERLLGGTAVDPRDHSDPLVRLLAATCAPAHPGEFVGEQIAMDAFRAAHLDLVRRPERRSMIQTALAKLLTLKVAVAAGVAVAATGGVALAASTGALPLPTGLGGHTAKATPTPGEATARPSEAAEAKGNASPSPSLVGLCHAYTAGAGDNPGKALENPAFSVLISAAGGKDKVAAYCETTLAAAKKGESSPSAGRPTSRPDGATNAHSTAKPDSAPSTKPSDAPNSHPTAAPTAHPSR